MHKIASSAAAVVKIGGQAAADGAIMPALAQAVAAGEPIVIVHGGGGEIDRALAERGAGTARIAGLRVTDEATLRTTEAVLCGSVNKRLVREARAAGLEAVGVSGQDGALLVAQRAADALGAVGVGVVCRPRLLLTLLAVGYTPIVAPLALDAETGEALNVNADDAASAVAMALGAGRLLFVTDVAAVRREAEDPASGIARMTRAEAAALAAECDGGMRPKLEAAVRALAGGVGGCFVGDGGVLRGGGTAIYG